MLIVLPFRAYSDNLESGIRLINALEFEKAQEVLGSIDLSKDSNALFWLAVAEYENGDRFKAGDTFEKAAELGNPWAMARLVPEWDNPCDLLGWPCNSSWKSKAIQNWEKLSEQGDGKAMYALVKHHKSWWNYIPYYRNKKLLEIAQEGVQHGGVAFLIDDSFWDADNALLLKLLRKSASEGYAPAMGKINNFLGLPVAERKAWLEKAVNLGYWKAARTLATFYWGGGYGFLNSPSLSYYYGVITKHLGITTYNNIPISKLGGALSGKVDDVEEEQSKLDKKAQEFLSNIKPNLFWNENTVDLY